jgi:hypothetical protein
MKNGVMDWMALFVSFFNFDDLALGYVHHHGLWCFSVQKRAVLELNLTGGLN